MLITRRVAHLTGSEILLYPRIIILVMCNYMYIKYSNLIGQSIGDPLLILTEIYLYMYMYMPIDLPGRYVLQVQ